MESTVSRLDNGLPWSRTGDKPSGPMMTQFTGPYLCRSQCFISWWRKMDKYTGSSVVDLMAFRLLGVKPLPEPMLSYLQLDSQEQISVKFWWKIRTTSFQRMHLKIVYSMSAIFFLSQYINRSSNNPHIACWRVNSLCLVTPYGDRSRSTLAEVMACWITVSSHYLNWSWLLSLGKSRHSPERKFTIDTSTINH